MLRFRKLRNEVVVPPWVDEAEKERGSLQVWREQKEWRYKQDESGVPARGVVAFEHRTGMRPRKQDIDFTAVNNKKHR